MMLKEIVFAGYATFDRARTETSISGIRLKDARCTFCQRHQDDMRGMP